MSVTSTSNYTVNNGTLAGGAAGGAEVSTYDAARGLIYILGPNGVDALHASNGTLAFSIPKSAILAPGGGGSLSLGTANSVAINGNNLAIAIDGATPGTSGYVAVFTVDGAGTAATWRATAQVGAVPDMITFTADGTRLLVAIEGEPAPSYTVDPAGALVIINTATWTPKSYGFEAFDSQAAALRAAGVKLNNAIPGSAGYNTVLPSLDLEPEYITVSADGRTAYVTLQENNAIGVFNLDPASGTVGWQAILPLGLKNFNTAGNGIDTSDRDGGANIRQVPVYGMYNPDAISSFTMNGKTYLVTANEGDAREWGSYVEAVRISALVPSSGSTPPAGMPALDPTLLAQIQSRRGDADLGRLEVSRWAGDTDGDGDLDQLVTFGGHSFSIWEVNGTGAATTLTQVYDSGQLIDQIVASQLPANYDDGRSDNKGAEPEGIAIGTINGQLHVFVGMERFNGNMAFRIDSPTQVSYQGIVAKSGDTGPEVSTFIPANGGEPAKLVVANETSGTTTVHNLSTASAGNYTLQILHGSDFEAGLLATQRADRFAAIVDKLEDSVANSITLSGGDNFLPGPFGAAGTDPSLIPVLRDYYAKVLGVTAAELSNLFGTSPAFFAADIAILNAIGIQASALGNHEFDLGTNPLASVIDVIANTTASTAAARLTNIGAQFPYLSANLSFANDPNIRALYTNTLREASTYATTRADIADNNAVAAEAADVQIAPWTTIVEGGQTIGVLAVTTQMLASLSSTGLTTVLDPARDGGVDNMAELASILQPYLDAMAAQGINKIVLLSHLQQYQNELALAPLLKGVDIIISAGSHAIFADGNDALRSGDRALEGYPVLRYGADGNPILITSTSNEYSYVGRLVATFDSNGVLIADPDGAGPLGVGGVDGVVSGAYATTDATVAALWGSEDPYAAGTRGGDVRAITNAVGTVINAKDGSVFGATKTFLEGRRGEVRTEETNLGNLSADANLFVARQVASDVLVSHKNGGGIRAEIGSYSTGAIAKELAPLENLSSGKEAGGVSQLDIENSLRFNNALSIVAVTAANLKVLLEHSVAASTGTATPGQFGQWGGISFSWDPAGTAQVMTGTGASATVATAGTRIKNAAIIGADGSVVQELVRDGVVVGDPARAIKMVTLNFLADGGDSYPFPAVTIAGSRIDLSGNALLADGEATFATKGTEQDALAEYMAATYTGGTHAYGAADTAASGDLRVINLSQRDDVVFQTTHARGTDGSDLLNGTAGNDLFDATIGRDTIHGGSGFDIVRFGTLARGDGGFIIGSDGGIDGFTFAINGKQGETYFTSVERLEFVDGKVDFSGSSPAAQVEALYRGLLGREADIEGLSYWAGRVEKGLSLGTLAKDLLDSPEGHTSGAVSSLSSYIDNLYQQVLGRGADAGAVSYWSGVAGAIGGTAGRAAVADGVIRSAEASGDPLGYAAKGIVTVDVEMAWVGWNFKTLLGREASVGELRHWDNQMEHGMSKAAVTKAFVESAEYGLRFDGLSNEAYVERLYQNILGRAADAAGHASYDAAVGGGDAAAAVVAYELLNSAEATGRHQQLSAVGLDLL
ncbi:DUF4214 domain-containing protein [Rhodovarius crocodyli]|uniref:DUF4214 domain-containing protein n=1 Tax=Rhodovarius crocodyli TaxID=1979269 RepID=A0A437M3R7_9PROT|nr:choice-of-anchor I family protein [Rhodovarius crocodyli]RVT92339.1 DUF4214 domain-containing protein [Rhodovarius crocodyli]